MNPPSAALSILLASLLAIQATEAEYQPFVAKTPPTTRVIVLDVTREKINCPDALPAISCIQGLVNRASSEKIFLKNAPFRCYFSVEEENPRNASRVGPGNPYEYMLDELIPFPKDYPRLDQSKESPALHYLLSRYRDLIKGQVRFRSFWGPDGPLTVNTAIFEDGILVSENLDRIIRSWGHDLPLLTDHQQVTDCFEGHRIAMEKYFDRPGRNTRTVGFGTTSVMLDYAMATRTFCSYFDKRNFDAAGQERIDRTLIDLLERYPDGIPVTGYIEITRVHHAIRDAGCQAVCGELPNASVTSSIPTDPSRFHPEKPGQVLEIDPDGVYITWYGVDIDAIDFSLLVYKSLRNDPAGGKAPLLIKMNPYFIDWFPTYFEWLTKLHPDQLDLFYAPYGDGPPAEPTRPTACAHYVANSNGAFGSDQVNPETHLPVFELMGGYTGEMGDYTSTWRFNKDTVWASKLGGMRLGPKNPHPYDPDVDEIVRYVKTSILNYAEPGKPYFIVGRIPSECGIDGFSLLVEAQNRLNADPDIVRSLHFVRPLDAAATFRHYQESGLYKQKPATFTGDPIAGLAHGDVSRRRAAARALLEDTPDPSRLDPLVAAFRVESDNATRRLLALAIGRIGPDAAKALPVLVAALADDTAGSAAAKALSQIGAASLDPLLTTIQGHDPAAVANAARGIEWLGKDATPAVAAIIRLLRQTDDASTQVALIKALGGIGAPADDATDVLLATLDSDHKPVLRAAIDALGKIGASEAVPALDAMLASDDAFDAGAAASALGGMGPAAKPAIPTLMVLLNKPDMDRYLQGQVAIALGRMQAGEALPRLVELLTERVQLASDATLALAEFGPVAKAAVPNLITDVLAHQWPEPRLRAVNTLAAIGPDAAAALPSLRKITSTDRDRMVRMAAATAIKTIQGRNENP